MLTRFRMMLLIFISHYVLCYSAIKRKLNHDFTRTQTVTPSSRIKTMTYPFRLPDLPYAYDALEPFIDAQTMRIHHTKHHQKYIDELNAALERYPTHQTTGLSELITHYQKLPADIQNSIRNNGGGHFNHSLFWLMMVPNAPQEPTNELGSALRKLFGSFDAFKTEFTAAAKKVFGSGWAWLCVTPQKTLTIIATSNQDNPLASGFTPILGLDVWEHAYYLKYQNKRPDYIDAWWHTINWDYIEQLYKQAVL